MTENITENMTMKKALSKVKNILGFKVSISVAGLMVLLVLTGVLTGNLIRNNPQALGLLKGKEILDREEEAFVTRVGKSISLPDEKPTVASVADLDKLSGQSFFENAKEGDKVLIYTNSKKVILYRPEEGRVVEVGAINIKGQGGEVAGLETEIFTVALLNGTEVTGLTKGVEEKLKEIMLGVEIKIKANAARTDYEKTIVVDLTGDKETMAKELAEKLGAEVSSLPEGERERGGVDFLVIVGQVSEE